MLRTPEALIPYILALACASAGGFWHAIGELASPAAVVTTGTAQVGGPFALIDQDRHRRTDAEFRGRWMLVYFGYTNCPDVCPTTMTLLSDVLKQLGPRADRVVPIFITLDPARDTPKVLKVYARAFDPRFVALTGSEREIATVAKAFRVYRARRPLPGGRYAVDHSNAICLMGPDGKFVTVYDNSQTADAVAADLERRL